MLLDAPPRCIRALTTRRKPASPSLVTRRYCFIQRTSAPVWVSDGPNERFAVVVLNLAFISETMRVAIIGAGPGGLVTCKTLLEAASDSFPFDPVIFEQEGDLGGTFRFRSYEVNPRAEMSRRMALNSAIACTAGLFEATYHFLRLSAPSGLPRPPVPRGELPEPVDCATSHFFLYRSMSNIFVHMHVILRSCHVSNTTARLRELPVMLRTRKAGT